MISITRKRCRWLDPTDLAKKLIEVWGEAGFIWLDGDGSELGRWVTLAIDPVNQICCRGLPNNPNATNPFDVLKHLEPGHWSGWLSYEAAAWIEPQNPWKSDEMATLWIARHDPIFRFDLQKKELWIEGCDENRIRQLFKWLEKIKPDTQGIDNSKLSPPKNKEIGVPINSWEWLTSKQQFTHDVERIQDWIATGDIFQANLTACCTTSLPEANSPINLFQRLRHHCPAPFAGMIIGADAAKGEAILSASPERFLKALPTGEVETRPIKGTRPRYPDPERDADMAIDLICSAKDRAENIMIVDLLRNDLGRVCKPGSIQVNQLVGLESYRQVHHLTSVITGCLQSNKTWVDLLQACWPGGSITGAPKLRACKRLHELEPTARGPYCGSLLHIDWNGVFDSSILIRSLMLKGKTLRANAGCGIVADSDPTNEAEELQWKLMPLLNALV